MDTLHALLGDNSYTAMGGPIDGERVEAKVGDNPLLYIEQGKEHLAVWKDEPNPWYWDGDDWYEVSK